MSWTNKLLFHFLMYTFVAFISYVVAVVADHILLKRELLVNEIYTTLVSFERYRAYAEDEELRRRALQDGFKSMYYPNLLREKKHEEFARRHRVAPLGPRPHEKLYYCNEGYGLVKYVSDRFGFRNSDAVWQSPVDVLLIGDSYTQGACVNDIELTLAGRLGNSFNVVNLGMASNGPIHYASLAKVFIGEVKPKYSVIVFYPNDNLTAGIDNEESLFYEYYWKNQPDSYFAKEGFLSGVSDRLEGFYNEFDLVLQESVEAEISVVTPKLEMPEFYEKAAGVADLIKEKYHPFWYAFSWESLRLNTLGSVGANIFSSQTLDFSSKLAIDTLAQECVEAKCVPIIVYIPNSLNWRPDGRAVVYRDLLESYAQERGMNFLDVTGELQSLNDSEAYAIKGPHLSPRGYEVVANALQKILH